MTVATAFLSLFHRTYVHEPVMYITARNSLSIWRPGGMGGGGYTHTKFHHGGLYNHDIF